MSQVSFIQSLEQSVLRIDQELSKREADSTYVLLSGGSVSSLMLHSFSLFNKKFSQRPIEAIYLQFDDFIWLEREAARTLARELNVPLKEIPISESQLFQIKTWKKSAEDERLNQLWQFIDVSLAAILQSAFVAGLGWQQYLRVENNLNLPGQSILSEIQPTPHRLDFYTSEVCSAFNEHELTKIFYSLWSEIPFASIRYWQDFVFKGDVPNFKPCMDWKFNHFMGPWK